MGLVLILAAGLVACSANGGRPAETDAPAYLGSEVQHADLLWLEPYESAELGDSLRYRKILDLEAFVARADVPVLLILRNTLDGSGPNLIPWAENLAMELQEGARIVFVDFLVEDDYLELLNDLTLPSYHLVHESRLIAEAEGLDAGALEGLLRQLYELLEKPA